MTVRHRYLMTPHGIRWRITIYDADGSVDSYFVNAWRNGGWQTIEMFDAKNRELIVPDI